MPTTVQENIEQLYRAQLATEVTYGTAVTTGTWIWPGKTIGWLDEQSKRELIKPKLGYYGDVNLAKILTTMGALKLASTPFDPVTCAEVMYYMFNTSKTGTVDTGSGTGWIFKTTLPTTSRQTANSLTAAIGGDFENEQGAGFLPVEYSISMDEEKYVMHDWSLVGRAPSPLSSNPAVWTPSTPPLFTYNSTTPALDFIRAPDVQLYLDAITAAGYGGTRINDALMKFKISIKGKLEPLFLNNSTQVVNAKGTPMPTRFVLTGPLEISGSLSFLSGVAPSGTGAANGQIALERANTAQLLRLRLPGKTLSVAGAYTLQGVDIDLPINFESHKNAFKNGIAYYDMPFKSNIDPYNMVSPNAGFITPVIDGAHAVSMVLPV